MGDSSAVVKGFNFEEETVKMLRGHGLEAWRTNKTNPDDPNGYKHGFDGGVDIIARYHCPIKERIDITFFIQCKCQKNDLTKTAIAEVYAGMHQRKAFANICVPVVIAVGDASQETIHYANDLGVELFMDKEFKTLKLASVTRKAPYDKYGILMRVLLYHATKDKVLIDTLPENKNELSDISMTEKLLEESKIDFDNAQSYLDRAEIMERRARENRQKALDIQRVAVFRSIQAQGLSNTKREKQTKKEQPTVIADSG